MGEINKMGLDIVALQPGFEHHIGNPVFCSIWIFITYNQTLCSHGCVYAHYVRAFPSWLSSAHNRTNNLKFQQFTTKLSYNYGTVCENVNVWSIYVFGWVCVMQRTMERKGMLRFHVWKVSLRSRSRRLDKTIERDGSPNNNACHRRFCRWFAALECIETHRKAPWEWTILYGGRTPRQSGQSGKINKSIRFCVRCE